MGTWGIAIKDNDAFADIYNEFYELYNKGGQPDSISKKIIKDNWEILEIEEEKHSLWFALALAQWETNSLDGKILSKVEDIISSGADLEIWKNLDVNEQNLKKRKITLDKFLEKIKSDKLKAKPRKRAKLKTPIFTTGDCLVFKMNNGNYGGAVVIATDINPETSNNLVATTRLNQNRKPKIEDFENAEVLICNFGEWQNKPHVIWYMPDLYYKEYSDIYEVVGKLPVEIEYDTKNYEGKGYLFIPSYTSGWSMNKVTERQFESEITKLKPAITLTIKQLTKKDKWWKFLKKNGL
jgi:hypothetical protein